jgi:uncharacterized damage-inducible protein DinB
MAGPFQMHFRGFALYNRWANSQLYAAAARLSPEALTQDRGAFFKSVLGVLNHLLLTDRLWRARFEERSPGAYRLDEILHEELEDLAQARVAEDKGIIGYVFALEEADYAAPLEYKTGTGVAYSEKTSALLAHWFNHQTHHRGQAHDLICQALGAENAPPLDLLIYQRFIAAEDRP